MQLTEGGKAAKAKISVGDVVLSIDGIATEGMTHLEAQNKIKACTGNLNLSLLRSSKTEELFAYGALGRVRPSRGPLPHAGSNALKMFRSAALVFQPVFMLSVSSEGFERVS
ncbi:PDZ and LIM domain protein 5 [Labeo rohita]|uniref:PDZ and LIM domain protein 5 n=1 Tax=Labeo rohita TaxID=84645 RepID=A0ABQ8MBC9_LABRO|nr:PDZ and LIM domain protein 5 [Labeo rohita]